MAALLPPNNIDAERCVLGSMLQDAEAALTASGLLKPEDFYHPAHSEIFSAMQAVRESGSPVDLVTVDAELANRGTLDGVGGTGYMIEISQYVPTTANVDAYIGIVRDASARRRIICILRDGAVKAAIPQSGEANAPEQIIEGVREQLAGIITRAGSGKSAQDMMVDAMLAMTRKTEDLQTSIPWLDAHFGLRDGELTVIGARPGIGKSILLFQIAAHVARHGRPALFFSMEMNSAQLGGRWFSSRVSVDLNAITRKNASLEEYERMAKLMSIDADALITLEDVRCSVGEIAAKARKHIRVHGPSLIVVDYLQLVKSGVRKPNREQEVAYISGELKGLAKELNVPVLTASQLSREMTRAGRRPNLADLRESGSLEQDADNVLFLHVPDEDGAKNKSFVPTEILIAKQRQGESGIYRTLICERKYVRFREATREEIAEGVSW